MSLERDLRAERVAYLDLTFFSLADGATPVRTVLERMRNAGHGCALITQDGHLSGIFTERDVLHRVVDHPETWDRPVEAVMTACPDTVRPTEPVAAALRSMNRGHYRNVPVVDGDGKIVGNLTHYAILKFFSDRFQQEIYNLPPDPDQVPKSPEGA
jgi:signal-transduction protein with cAMP-binding, CBS, and nucleotidyltransferase domain